MKGMHKINKKPKSSVALGYSQSYQLHRFGGNKITDVSLSQNSGGAASTHVINPEVSIKKSSAHLLCTSNSNGTPVLEKLDEMKTMKFPCFYGDSKTQNKNEHNTLQHMQSAQIMEDSLLNINTDNEEDHTDSTGCSTCYDCLDKKADDSNALGYHQEERQQKVLQPEHLPSMNPQQSYSKNKSGLRTQNSTSDDYLAAASCDFEEIMSIPPLNLKNDEPLSDDSSNDDPPSCRIGLGSFNNVLPANVSWRHTSGGNCDLSSECQQYKANDSVAQNINAEYWQPNHSCPPSRSIKVASFDYEEKMSIPPLDLKEHECLPAGVTKSLQSNNSYDDPPSCRKHMEPTNGLLPENVSSRISGKDKDRESQKYKLEVGEAINFNYEQVPMESQTCRSCYFVIHNQNENNAFQKEQHPQCTVEPRPYISPDNEEGQKDPEDCYCYCDCMAENINDSSSFGYKQKKKQQLASQPEHFLSNSSSTSVFDGREQKICCASLHYEQRFDNKSPKAEDLRTQNSTSDDYLAAASCDFEEVMSIPPLDLKNDEPLSDDSSNDDPPSCRDYLAAASCDFEETMSIPPLDLKNDEPLSDDSSNDDPPSCRISFGSFNNVARDYKDLRTRNHKYDDYLAAEGGKLMKKRRSRSCIISLQKKAFDFEDSISIPPLDLKDKESSDDDPPSCRISMGGPHRGSTENESMCWFTNTRSLDDPPSCRISLDFQNSVLPENLSYRHTCGGNCDPKLESQKHEAEIKFEESGSCYDCADQNIIEPKKQEQALETVPDAQDFENLRAQNYKSDECLAAVSSKQIESRLSCSCCNSLQSETMNPTVSDISSFSSLLLKRHQRLNDPPSCCCKNASKTYLHKNMSLASPETDYMHSSCIDDQLTCSGLCHKEKLYPFTSKKSGNLEGYRDSIRDNKQFSCLKSSPDNKHRNFVGEGTHFSESSDCGNSDNDPKVTSVKPRGQTFTMQGLPANNELCNYEEQAEPNNELNENESLCRQPQMDSDEKLGVEENFKLETKLSPEQLHKNSLSESSSKKMLQVDDDIADHNIYQDSSQSLPNKFCLENSAQGAFSTDQEQLPDKNPSMHRSAVLCSPRILINYSDSNADKCKPELLRHSSVNTLCEVWNQESDCKCCHRDLDVLQLKTIDKVHAGRAGDSILPTSERRLAIKRTEYFHQVFSQLTRKQRAEETALRLRQMRLFQESFDSHYKNRLLENGCLTSQPNQAHSDKMIYTTKYKCPLSKTNKCMPVLNEQLLTHFLREHVNGMERNEPSAIYKTAIILIELRPLTFALGNNVCVSLMVYGGTMGCTDTLPIKRFMPVYNADLPLVYRHYIGYLPMMLMVCRTTLSAIGERPENEANDETVVALWVVSMNLPQPLHIMLTLFNRRLDVTRSAIMQTRSLSQSQDAHEFMSRSNHYMRLSELDIYMLSNAFRDGINIELSVREYNAAA